MREYDYDENEEYQDEMDEFYDDDDDDDDDDEIEDLAKRNIIRAMELEIVENSMDLKLLKDAIGMCEKSFWWRFYSFKTKIKMITQSYAIIDKLVMEVRDRRRQNED